MRNYSPNALIIIISWFVAKLKMYQNKLRCIIISPKEQCPFIYLFSNENTLFFNNYNSQMLKFSLHEHPVSHDIKHCQMHHILIYQMGTKALSLILAMRSFDLG